MLNYCGFGELLWDWSCFVECRKALLDSAVHGGVLNYVFFFSLPGGVFVGALGGLVSCGFVVGEG